MKHHQMKQNITRRLAPWRIVRRKLSTRRVRESFEELLKFKKSSFCPNFKLVAFSSFHAVRPRPLDDSLESHVLPMSLRPIMFFRTCNLPNRGVPPTYQKQISQESILFTWWVEKCVNWPKFSTQVTFESP